MKKVIPYGHQEISEEDIRAVVDVLRSDFLTQGPAISQFEEKVARYCGVRHAIAVSNATAALHIAAISLGLRNGKRLWTSPNSFVASANAGLYCEAEVDFVDIDPISLNISVPELSRKLEHAKKVGTLPDVLVPVHFSGQSASMKEIAELAKQYGFAVMEDAAHALGGRYENQPIGACTYSDAAILSFHPVKIITTGEGGMVVTNRDDLAQHLRRLRTHGITRDTSLFASESHGGWYYEQIELGFNFRMTDLQAALGTSQMNRLDAFVARRHELAHRYDQALAGLPLILPKRDVGYSSLHLYVVQVDSTKTDKTRREVYDALIANGVGANVHYIPIHLQPHYRRMGFKAGDFPKAEAYYHRAITLPLFPTMSEGDQDRVVHALRSVLK
jgi:UDP-4-amino-4,6-dideoxy-N-acetyl-beta-L-altrosamine transaminase